MFNAMQNCKDKQKKKGDKTKKQNTKSRNKVVQGNQQK